MAKLKPLSTISYKLQVNNIYKQPLDGHIIGPPNIPSLADNYDSLGTRSLTKYTKPLKCDGDKCGITASLHVRPRSLKLLGQTKDTSTHRRRWVLGQTESIRFQCTTVLHGTASGTFGAPAVRFTRYIAHAVITVRPIEAVHLTSFSQQTNHQCVTIVNIHHNSLSTCTRCFDGQFLLLSRGCTASIGRIELVRNGVLITIVTHTQSQICLVLPSQGSNMMTIVNCTQIRLALYRLNDKPW